MQTKTRYVFPDGKLDEREGTPPQHHGFLIIDGKPYGVVKTESGQRTTGPNSSSALHNPNVEQIIVVKLRNLTPYEIEQRAPKLERQSTTTPDRVHAETIFGGAFRQLSQDDRFIVLVRHDVAKQDAADALRQLADAEVA